MAAAGTLRRTPVFPPVSAELSGKLRVYVERDANMSELAAGDVLSLEAAELLRGLDGSGDEPDAGGATARRWRCR